VLQAVVRLFEALRYKQYCSWLRHCATSSSAVGWGTKLPARRSRVPLPMV